MPQILDRVLTEGQITALGLKGTTVITDTVSHTSEGPWLAVVPKEDTVFTTLTDSLRDGNSIAGETWVAGMFLPGDITEIELASGAVIAYKQPATS